MKKMKQIGVIGAGVMGAGIIQTIAKKGYEVRFVAEDEAAVKRGFLYIDTALSKQVKKEKITDKEAEEIRARINGSIDINIVADADMVVEAVIENIELKREIFSKLDKICRPEVILTTNTSALSITQIALSTKRPDKVVGMHFFNPVPVMKLVEVINGELTAKETQDHVLEFAEDLGKSPVKVKEAPGFVVNRILIPLINEAAAVLEEGTANAEDIDKAMQLGANFPMGPLALGDLIGLDVCVLIMKTLYEGYKEDKFLPNKLMLEKVDEGKLGRKTGEGFFSYE